MALALSACGPPASTTVPPILLFSGRGTSPNDVAAIERILSDKHFSYATADSAQLNAMSPQQLRAHRLLIIPGGNYVAIGENLTPTATANIRAAVNDGLSYLGICAGALLAGDAKSNSLNLTSGVRFDFYSLVNQNIHKAAVAVTDADGTTLDHYWEDGPQLSGWGDVVARYPDGTPAIVEGDRGMGRVILCGVHPEAPDNWRTGLTFATPTSASHAYASRLIDAALYRTQLPHD